MRAPPRAPSRCAPRDLSARVAVEPSPSSSAGVLELLDSFGCTVNCSGVRSRSRPSSRTAPPARQCHVRAGRAVELVLAGSLLDGSCSAVATMRAFRRWWRIVRLSHTSCPSRSTSARLTTPSVISWSAHSSYTRLEVLICGVHLRLRVGGLVGLVVPEAPVADQVDQHVVPELLAERNRQAHRAHAGRHVVGVDVDDRHVEALGQI